MFLEVDNGFLQFNETEWVGWMQVDARRITPRLRRDVDRLVARKQVSPSSSSTLLFSTIVFSSSTLLFSAILLPVVVFPVVVHSYFRPLFL